MGKNGIIICGYQGIGKSTLAGKNNCIDLESSLFEADGKKPDKWWLIYSKVAVDLSCQGYTVFTSCHKLVREGLKIICPSNRLVVVCPDWSLKEAWIKKLEERFIKTTSTKDLHAWERARDYFKEDISEIMENHNYYAIGSMDYKLADIVENIKAAMLPDYKSPVTDISRLVLKEKDINI